ncbi:hypothetical protein B2H91_05490 [Clostridium botulinum]|uniref:restriction endonuclease subunit S n=1 Tax=Clostridium botulinum TaxID=1491 RepID=UPI000A17300C|nr:restriction endonuclease subunit S [Clostridium botulinum]AUN18022.1 hypothetical protein B2M06_10620 [Clostridium botulinum]OSA87674.1 hypothetical protein B2H91_05490 [Clostridium botulinum]
MIVQTYKIRDIGKVISGYAFKSKDFISKAKENDIPVIKIKNIGSGKLNLENISFVSNKFLEMDEKYHINKGDILISLTGSHVNQPNSVVGRIAKSQYDKTFLLNQRAGKVMVDSNSGICDRSYLYYYISSENFKKKIINLAHGAANQANVSPKDIENIIVELPNIIQQKKIAKILSAYDDLIENNLKRIKLLEESADLIYKEWFVNFRFPGHEKCEFIDEIPEKWEKINLYDISEVKMGYAFKSNDFNEEELGTPAIRIRDIPNQTTKTYTTQKADEDYIVKRGDILIGMDGAFYNDVWGGEEGYLVQRVCRLRANDPKYHGYLWQAIKEPINYYEKTIIGATVAHLGAKHLKEIYILKTSREFELNLEVFNNLYKKKVNLLQQNQKLKEARDILIPKLIMGEIEV